MPKDNKRHNYRKYRRVIAACIEPESDWLVISQGQMASGLKNPRG